MAWANSQGAGPAYGSRHIKRFNHSWTSSDTNGSAATVNSSTIAQLYEIPLVRELDVGKGSRPMSKHSWASASEPALLQSSGVSSGLVSARVAYIHAPIRLVAKCAVLTRSWFTLGFSVCVCVFFVGIIGGGVPHYFRRITARKKMRER
jgi:hypothetical protein